MSGLHADTAAIDLNGRETVANAEYLNNEIVSLRNNVEGLETIWNGISANEFGHSFEEQEKNLQAFRQLLNDLGEAISKSANILNQTEEENAERGKNLFNI